MFRTIRTILAVIALLTATGMTGAALQALAPQAALAAVDRPDMVSVHYVRDDVYTLAITNESGHAVEDPGINLFRGHAFAWADDNRVVPVGGKFTVTLRLADGTWSLGTVDSMPPGNPDGEYSDYAQRWNGSNTITVR
jgi:hypothetical protein